MIEGRKPADLPVEQLSKFELEAIKEWIRKDLGIDSEGVLALTAKADPVLAELWDNRKDSEYDRL